MEIPKDAKLLRIFIGEEDKYNGKPLYEAIVQSALDEKLAGATVIKGIISYGCSTHIHTSKIVDLGEDLPLVVEIVDSEQNIQKFLPKLDQMITSGLVTIENANVIVYKGKPKK